MQEHLPLWNKIQSFSIDNGTAVVPFSAKLAASQNWSIEFTQRAIEEYKRFILLCCISEKGAAPSQTVDEVWHLHLTYTQSYWIDFCRNTLGKDIHHHPSTGGDQESNKHREWYKETLQLYRTVFGVDPPSDIWPAPASGQHTSSSDWPVPDDPPVVWPRPAVLTLGGLLLLPFAFLVMAYGTLSPFTLGGPHFLIFFPIYGIALLCGYIVHRRLVKKKIKEIAVAYLPGDVTSFQMVNFLYGKHRALQMGIVDLVNRQLLEVTRGDLFLVKNANYTPEPGDENPLLSACAGAPDQSLRSYQEILGNWCDSAKFAHPALQALDKFVQRPESASRAYHFHLALYVMVLARVSQAIVHQRPVGFFVLEIIGLSLLLLAAVKYFSKRSVVQKIVRQRLQSLIDTDKELVHQFALEGSRAMDGWGEGALLAGIFAVYTPVNSWIDWSSGSNSGSSSDSGGSSCGGSSCGSSCGSGCGGCGGGH